MTLSDAQRQAVEYCDGAQLVIAGAGSGKTRVLTCKIAWLLERGLPPWSILALTFTNKAAREMRERVAQMVGEQTAAQLYMGTFHSIFARILRAEAPLIGYQPNFTIYDQADARSLIKNVTKALGLDEKAYKPASVGDRISRAKNGLLLPQAYAANAQLTQNDAQRGMPAIKDIYIRYAERCRQANAMDFDDLLLNTFQLFANHEETRQKYAGRFAYVLVDEYQDTNAVQQKIVAQLTRERQKVCAVGDDAQSIYSFRGANIDNILQFTKTYPSARLFKLERNYRSTQTIVNAANSLIRHNARQIPKDVFSENEVGEKIALIPAYSDREEAATVCQDIKAVKRSDKCEYCDFAILYRTNAQSRSFEEYLRREAIPYRVYGGLSFYQRKEIKDIVAYMRLVANNDDEEALRRVINYPARGIGATTLDKIAAAAAQAGISLWRAIGQPEACGLTAGAKAKVEEFRRMVESWTQRSQTEDVYTLGQEILAQSGLAKELLRGSEPEDVARRENVEEFNAAMQEFVARREEEGDESALLPQFLQEISLLTDLDSEGDDNSPRVALMTIHSAKGLEFPNVYIVGLEENIFPSPQCCDNMRALEEERRLLYVAITRAMRRCTLTYAQCRYRYGRMDFDNPSRFIADISPKYLRTERPGDIPSPRTAQQFAPRKTLSAGPRLRRVEQATAAETPTPEAHTLSAGTIIDHQRFGVGKVMKVEGAGENEKATVEFDKAGTKQLLLKFARYKIVGR